jgi:Ca2+-binding RTX toxin-like protein
MRLELILSTSLLFIAGLIPVQSAFGGTDEFDPSFRCRLVSAGPEGPKGDFVKVTFLDHWVDPVVKIRQTGETLEFAAGDFYGGFGSAAHPGACGGAATDVNSIDRIDLHFRPRSNGSILIDASKAGSNPVLAPGATAERAGSEIEIRVLGQKERYRSRGFLTIKLPETDDRVYAGTRGELAVVNLNSGEDGKFQDSDILPGLATDEIAIESGAGDDFVSGNGGGGLPDLTTWTAFYALGGPGSDRLIGHGGRDKMNGGHGRDIVRGLGGNDYREYDDFGLTGGPGADRVYGGAGNDMLGSGDDGRDRIFAGTGEDYVYAADRSKDFVDCGPGAERELQLDRVDVTRNCKSPN